MSWFLKFAHERQFDKSFMLGLIYAGFKLHTIGQVLNEGLVVIVLFQIDISFEGLVVISVHIK